MTRRLKYNSPSLILVIHTENRAIFKFFSVCRYSSMDCKFSMHFLIMHDAAEVVIYNRVAYNVFHNESSTFSHFSALSYEMSEMRKKHRWNDQFSSEHSPLLRVSLLIQPFLVSENSIHWTFSAIIDFKSLHWYKSVNRNMSLDLCRKLIVSESDAANMCSNWVEMLNFVNRTFSSGEVN